MKLKDMAAEALGAPAGDVVLLAQGADPRGLDLRALTEYETRPGGGVRVKLMDRAALIAALVRAGWLEEGDPEAADRLYGALEGAVVGWPPEEEDPFDEPPQEEAQEGI